MKGKNKLCSSSFGNDAREYHARRRENEGSDEDLALDDGSLLGAASPNSFTLDFGDYSYYSVQTTEGELISRLIAGYIDIILKKVRG